MTIEDVPIPGMPDLPTLWAVHVQGPDDVIAAVDRAEADQRAKEINDAWEEFTKRPNYDPKLHPKWNAYVVEWPYTRDGHAEEIAEGDERWAIL